MSNLGISRLHFPQTLRYLYSLSSTLGANPGSFQRLLLLGMPGGPFLFWGDCLEPPR